LFLHGPALRRVRELAPRGVKLVPIEAFRVEG
jgi:hypothetical protein